MKRWGVVLLCILLPACLGGCRKAPDTLTGGGTLLRMPVPEPEIPDRRDPVYLFGDGDFIVLGEPEVSQISQSETPYTDPFTGEQETAVVEFSTYRRVAENGEFLELIELCYGGERFEVQEKGSRVSSSILYGYPMALGGGLYVSLYYPDRPDSGGDDRRAALFDAAVDEILFSAGRELVAHQYDNIMFELYFGGELRRSDFYRADGTNGRFVPN